MKLDFQILKSNEVSFSDIKKLIRDVDTKDNSKEKLKEKNNVMNFTNEFHIWCLKHII